MKKGFTLIELLAVILILGIIALIAIPTVNNILKEAREGAFKTSSDNIMKAMEEACQTSLIKGENPILGYTFNEGKSNFKLEIKGTMPDDGYVFLDNNCSVTDYYLKDQNNVYSTSDDYRNEYMLNASTEEEKSLFQTLYSDYFDQIISINFINNLNIHEGAIEIKNPSISGSEKVKSWLVADGSNYHLYIGSDDKIFANYDSSYLFYNFTNVTQINIDNLYTDFTTTMVSMFEDCKNIISLDVNHFRMFNATNIKSMFSGCSKLTNIKFDDWDTSNITNMGFLFSMSSKLKNFNVSSWDTSNVTEMRLLFYNCDSIVSLDLSTWNTSKVKNMNSMFFSCDNLQNLNIANWNTSSLQNISSMFFQSAKIKTIDINNWDVTKVNDMSSLFLGCRALEEVDLSKWSTPNLTKMDKMFSTCTVLKTVDLSNFIVSSVTSVTDLFVSAENVNTIKAKANTINMIKDVIPDRSATTFGSLIIIGDATSLDTTTLSAKNWNVV